jgi:hypothetical protein
MMVFPGNANGLRAAGYRFLDHDVCIICQVPIEWWLTPQSRNIPMNPMPTEDTPAVGHWVTCKDPDALSEEVNSK